MICAIDRLRPTAGTGAGYMEVLFTKLRRIAPLDFLLLFRGRSDAMRPSVTRTSVVRRRSPAELDLQSWHCFTAAYSELVWNLDPYGMDCFTAAFAKLDFHASFSWLVEFLTVRDLDA